MSDAVKALRALIGNDYSEDETAPIFTAISAVEREMADLQGRLDQVRKLAAKYRYSCSGGPHESECCALDFSNELLAILDWKETA